MADVALSEDSTEYGRCPSLLAGSPGRTRLLRSKHSASPCVTFPSGSWRNMLRGLILLASAGFTSCVMRLDVSAPVSCFCSSLSKFSLALQREFLTWDLHDRGGLPVCAAAFCSPNRLLYPHRVPSSSQRCRPTSHPSGFLRERFPGQDSLHFVQGKLTRVLAGPRIRLKKGTLWSPFFNLAPRVQPSS